MAVSINNNSINGTNTNDATAVANDILAGKTAYIGGKKVTGTMPSKAAATITPSTSNQTIAAGQYISGVQTIAGDADLISANIKAGANIFGVAGNSNVVDTSAGTATAAQILSGQIAFVDGAKVTGTMVSKAAATYTPGTSNQTISAGQYLAGTQTIAGDADLIPGNIKSGVSIFGVTGTYNVPTTYNTVVNAAIAKTTVTQDKNCITLLDCGTVTVASKGYSLRTANPIKFKFNQAGTYHICLASRTYTTYPHTSRRMRFTMNGNVIVDFTYNAVDESNDYTENIDSSGQWINMINGNAYLAPKVNDWNQDFGYTGKAFTVTPDDIFEIRHYGGTSSIDSNVKWGDNQVVYNNTGSTVNDYNEFYRLKLYVNQSVATFNSDGSINITQKSTIDVASLITIL